MSDRSTGGGKRAPRALRPGPPAPPTDPSPAAKRALKIIEELIHDPETPADYVQRQVDMTHIWARVSGAYDGLLYEAIRNPGPATYAAMVKATGLSKSAIQQRVDNADPAKPSRSETVQAQRERAAAKTDPGGSP